MSEKEQLQKRLKEIEEQESKDSSEKELQKYHDDGVYIPCGKAKVKRNIWYVTEYRFQEMADGWYSQNALLGSPEFKKDQILMKIKTPDGQYFYCEEQESMNDYAYIEDNEQVFWETDWDEDYITELE